MISNVQVNRPIDVFENSNGVEKRSKNDQMTEDKVRKKDSVIINLSSEAEKIIEENNKHNKYEHSKEISSKNLEKIQKKIIFKNKEITVFHSEYNNDYTMIFFSPQCPNGVSAYLSPFKKIFGDQKDISKISINLPNFPKYYHQKIDEGEFYNSFNQMENINGAVKDNNDSPIFCRQLAFEFLKMDDDYYKYFSSEQGIRRIPSLMENKYDMEKIKLRASSMHFFAFDAFGNLISELLQDMKIGDKKRLYY